MDSNMVYTPSELQGVLKMSRSSVYELLRTGAIRAKRIGRVLRVSRKDLETFLRED